MGLDMYFTKVVEVYAQYEFSEVTGTIDLKAHNLPLPIDVTKVTEIHESFGYWCKANAIHNWFVENVQEGNDNCSKYYVDMSQIEDLLKVVNQALAQRKKAGSLLPTQEGFFFGSTEYDDDYFDDLQHTKEIMERALEFKGNPNVHFEYQSSW